MGDDSTRRKVVSITVGKGQMYKIIPTKGEPFVCNGPHILCLKSSGYCHVMHAVKEKRYKVRYFDENSNIKNINNDSFSNNRSFLNNLQQRFL
jgi:hypothetical protein